jgi:hypothetical protein
VTVLRAEDLQRLARSGKGASAALSAVADAVRDYQVDIAALRCRAELGSDAPAESWEVERHRFMRGQGGSLS